MGGGFLPAPGKPLSFEGFWGSFFQFLAENGGGGGGGSSSIGSGDVSLIQGGLLALSPAPFKGGLFLNSGLLWDGFSSLDDGGKGFFVHGFAEVGAMDGSSSSSDGLTGGFFIHGFKGGGSSFSSKGLPNGFFAHDGLALTEVGGPSLLSDGFPEGFFIHGLGEASASGVFPIGFFVHGLEASSGTGGGTGDIFLVHGLLGSCGSRSLPVAPDLPGIERERV